MINILTVNNEDPWIALTNTFIEEEGMKAIAQSIA